METETIIKILKVLLGLIFFSGIGTLILGDWIIGIFLLLIFLLAFLFGLRKIPEQERWVIETLGSYYKTVGPGIVWIPPFIGKWRTKVPLWEQSKMLFTDSPSLDFRQGGTAKLVNAKAWLKATDPRKATYEVRQWDVRVKETLENYLRTFFGKLSVDEVIERKGNLGQSSWWEELRKKFPELETKFYKAFLNEID